MTTMTRAEYEHAEDLAQIRADVAVDVTPEGEAEDYVCDLEHEHGATEDDPLVIDNAEGHAEALAEDVEATAEACALSLGASDADAAGIAEGFYEDTLDAVLREFERAPTIEVREQ